MSQTDPQVPRSQSPPVQVATSDPGDPPTSLQPPVYPDMFNAAAFAGQGVNPAMAMSGSGYQMIPAYYDQSGALIVNRAPVHLLAPGIPAPMFLNGSQGQL